MRKVLEYPYTGDYTLGFEKPVIGGTGNTASSGNANSRQSGSVTRSMSKALNKTGPVSKAPSTQSQQDTPLAVGSMSSGCASRRTSEGFHYLQSENRAYFHAPICTEADYFLLGGSSGKLDSACQMRSRRLFNKGALEEIGNHGNLFE